MTRTMLDLIFGITAMLLTIGRLAYAEEPPSLELDEGPSFRLQAELPSMGVNGLLIKLESTNIDSFAKTIGVGIVSRRGDAANSVKSVCYTVKQPIRARIWITASELNGGSTVDGFTVRQAADDSSVAMCPVVKSGFVISSTGGRLWISDTLEHWKPLGLIRIEDETSSRQNFTLTRKFTRTSAGSKTEELTTVQSMRIRAVRGAIESFSMTQSTSD